MTPAQAKSTTRRASAGAPVALLLLLTAGCSSLDTPRDSLEYRAKAAKTAPLDVPPDLSQLARDGRYAPQAGVVVSANAVRAQPGIGAPLPAAAAASGPDARPVAPNAVGDFRVLRDGDVRWISTTVPPEQLYPIVRAYWLDSGFKLLTDNPDIGVLQTDWAENRAKLSDGLIRRTLGRVFDNFASTGERDQFRTRIERTASGSEIYLSHRGLEEVALPDKPEITTWRRRATDPQLEAEQLSRLLVRLGGLEAAPARSAVAEAAAPAPAAGGSAAAPARVTAAPQASSLQLSEPFDRAWRQIGLALDRTGLSVEDRDRSAGLYFVRYVDPKVATEEEPGFFARLFSSDKTNRGVQRLRIQLKSAGDRTQVSVQDGSGKPEEGEAARHIIARLSEVLR